jgi:hypothetical protein
MASPGPRQVAADRPWESKTGKPPSRRASRRQTSVASNPPAPHPRAPAREDPPWNQVRKPRSAPHGESVVEWKPSGPPRADGRPPAVVRVRPMRAEAAGREAKRPTAAEEARRRKVN